MNMLISTEYFEKLYRVNKTNASKIICYTKSNEMSESLDDQLNIYLLYESRKLHFLSITKSTRHIAYSMQQ